jgi:hypothetical protein
MEDGRWMDGWMIRGGRMTVIASSGRLKAVTSSKSRTEYGVAGARLLMADIYDGLVFTEAIRAGA